MGNEVRLIDLNRTCYELERFYNGYTGELRRVASEALDLVCMMPEVDPESLRPKGRWELVGEADYKCSVCSFRFTSGEPIEMFPYCRCGAKMEG